MPHFLRICLIIFLSCFAILGAMDLLYTWTLTRQPLANIRKNQHYDLLIAGDSRTLPLLPEYLDIITGKKTINIGSPSYTIEDNKRIMKYFFERGNRVDKVYLQYDLRFGTQKQVAVDWQYQPYMIEHAGWITPRIPFQFYALNNANFTFKEVSKKLREQLKNVPPPPFDSTDALNDFRPFVFNQKLLKDHSDKPLLIKELLEFDVFLKQHGVQELILFTAPFSPNWFPSQKDTSIYKKKVRNAGFRYYDFSTVYADTSYFLDYTHIKHTKYLEFCRLFSQELKLIDTTP